MKYFSDVHHFSTISQLMRRLGLPAPSHPLITLVDYAGVSVSALDKGLKISLDFYKISFKKSFRGQVRYGQGYYDFEEGGLAFLEPRQLTISPNNSASYEGYALYFHPDFLRGYPLRDAIKQFGFFSYEATEALFLSAKERDIITSLFTGIANELATNIDSFSQSVLVSQIELLLNYSNRFYNRQFITRKVVNHQIITSLNKLLAAYFAQNQGLQDGLPSVQYVSAQLNVSQRYLSDLLRSLVGQNTQQYIQDKLIEQAKDLLISTALSVAEIAYNFGFEHPQSFSKLFKLKTNRSPLEFRQAFS